MIKILREKQEKPVYVKVTTINCNCGAIFQASEDEFNDEDTMLGLPFGGS